MNDNIIILLFLLVYFSPAIYQLRFVLKERSKGNSKPFKKLLRILKFSLIILIPVTIFFVALVYINFLDYERPIPYSKIDSISFKNFRGFEFFKKSLYGNKRFAYIVTEIKSSINQEHVIIETYFHPSRSFVYNTHSKNKELLTHELYHFRIAELYSRLAKQKISNLDSLTEFEIKKIINDYKIKERDYQRDYDYDTFHSYVLSEQKKYEKTVDSLLNLLSEFKNPKVKIYVKD
ncbi:hypothetical protein Q4Q34_04145 [Flavivirga abyssicola]|uniref:hypothetical protein n=1 Tax=Flavivirga abyssicola TaxID=3063533 RepID=UPI0026E020CB|nr:hypothetical protein [Flavivirga sp. MEBiC07777]WVK14218.1 hypothetical protein Q4Q34_04145 [Flavivirga sp. MEBiC07777]